MSAFAGKFASVVGRTWTSPSMGVRKIRDGLKREGRFVYGFDAGELPFSMPARVVYAIRNYVSEGHVHYTSVEGTPDFLRAVSDEFRRGGLEYSTKEILGTPGAKSGIYAGLLATIEPGRGDEVIILTPGWYGFGQAVDHHDGKPVYVCGLVENSYKVLPSQLHAAITDKTRWLILNSPANPTGVTYTADELRAFADVLKRHPHVFVLIDDAYEHLVLGDRKHVNLLHVAPELRDRTLIVSSLSKGFCMAGLRIGWAAGPQDLIEQMIFLQRAHSLNASVVGQVGAIAAFTNPPMLKDLGYRKICAEKLSAVHEVIEGIPGFKCPMPEGGFSHFVDVRDLLPAVAPDDILLETDVALSEWLLRRHGILPAPGTSFHYQGGLRFSCVMNEDEEHTALNGAFIVRDAIAELRPAPRV